MQMYQMWSRMAIQSRKAESLSSMYVQSLERTAEDKMSYPKVSISIRLWSKVRKRRNGCFEWIGCKNERGYGVIHLDNKNTYTHRVSWILTNGPILNGMFVLHRCDNPSCVNPDHLFLGTPKDNIQDMFSKGRDMHTKGFKYSEKTKSKMSESGKHKVFSKSHKENLSKSQMGRTAWNKGLKNLKADY